MPSIAGRRRVRLGQNRAGLDVGDVGFDRKTVTFRPNGFRRLKTPSSLRSVPLWPQLEAILKPYTDERVIARGTLLSGR